MNPERFGSVLRVWGWGGGALRLGEEGHKGEGWLTSASKHSWLLGTPAWPRSLSPCLESPDLRGPYPGPDRLPSPLLILVSLQSPHSRVLLPAPPSLSLPPTDLLLLLPGVPWSPARAPTPVPTPQPTPAVYHTVLAALASIFSCYPLCPVDAL